MGSSFTAVHTIHYIDPVTVRERIAKPGDLLSGLPEDVADRLEAAGAVVRSPDDDPPAEPEVETGAADESSETGGLESEETLAETEELPPVAEPPEPAAVSGQKPKATKPKGKAAGVTASDDDDLI